MKIKIHSIAFLFSLLFTGFYAFYFLESAHPDRTHLRNILQSHPYSNPHRKFPDEIKTMGKPAAPDLAWEQDFLRTMDPALGRPAPERLPATLAAMHSMRNMQVAPGSASAPWVERGPNNVGGRTRALAWDPNDVNQKKVWAAGVSGGLWFNNDITNAASSWNPVNNFWENIAVTCITFDPINPQIIYVGTGEGFGTGAARGAGIWKSTNGGSSWAQISNTATFYYILDIVVRNESGTSVVYAAVDGYYYKGVWHGENNAGIQRSINGGGSWTNVSPNIPSTSVKMVASDLEISANGRIWAGSKAAPFTATDRGGGKIYYTDNGVTWILSNTSTVTNGKGRVEIACAPSNANVVYAVVENDNQASEMKKTTTAGTSWAAINKPQDTDIGIPAADFTRGQAWYDLIMAVDPLNENTLLVGGIDLFRSTTAGSSWSQISKWSNNNDLSGLNCALVHADQHAIVFKPGSSSTVLFGNDGGVFYTSNISSAATSAVISSRNKDYNVTQYYSCALHPGNGSNIMLAGAQDNGTQRYNVAGMNTTSEVSGGDGAFCFIDQTNGAFAVASYVYNTFYLSTNSGVDFTQTLIDDDQTGKFINPADYDDNNDVLYSGKSSSSIYRVRNITTTPGTPETVNIPGMTDAASHIRASGYSNAVFVGTEVGEIFKLSNANGTPVVTNLTKSNLPAGSVSCIELGANENEILLTFFNYGVTSVWYTADGGTNWVSKEGNLPDMPVRWALFNPGNRSEVILATELGVWSSSNFNQTIPSWTATNLGLSNVRVDMLQIRNSDKMVIAATYGRGLFSSLAFSLSNPPLAAFKADKLAPCLNDTVQLTDTSNVIAGSYLWTISPATFSYVGGTSASSQHPKVIFSATGSYSVKLKVSNAGGSDSLLKTDYISAGGFGLPYTENWENSNTYSGWFVDNPDGKTSWSIYNVSGNGSGTKAAGIDNFNYSDAGLAIIRDGLMSPPVNLSGYSSVTLSFKHAYRRYDAATMDSLAVYVSTNCGTSWLRVASFRETASSSPFNFITRSDLSTDFFPTSVSDWCGNTGYASCKTINLSAFAGLNIKVKFENISGYGNNLFIDDISITGVSALPPPVANFTASSTAPCANTQVNFTDQTSNSPNSWNWSFNPNTVIYVNGTSAVSRNPQVQFTAGGVYTVSLTAGNTNSNDNETKSAYINVSSSLIPTITVSTNDSMLCAGNQAVFNAAIVNGGTTPVYQWKVNSTSVGSNSNTFTAASLNNNDTVYCILSSNATCAVPAMVVSNKRVIKVNAKPNVGFVLINNKTCLQDTLLPLSGGSPLGGVYSGSGVSAGKFNPSVSGTGTHVLTYSFTDANNCSAQANASMLVSAFPAIPLITQTGNTLSCDVSGVSYQWYKDNTAISGAQSQTFDLVSSGNYQVEITNSGGCSKRSLVFNANKTKLDEIRYLSAFLLYPNPARTEVNLSFDLKKAASLNIEILDMAGRVVHRENGNFVQGNCLVQIPVSQLSNGSYLIKLSDGDKQLQRLLIIQ